MQIRCHVQYQGVLKRSKGPDCLNGVITSVSPSRQWTNSSISKAPEPASAHRVNERQDLRNIPHFRYANIHRRNVRCYASGRLPMSAAVIEIVTQAKQQVARQGVLFVGLDQLVLGLLGAPCHSAHILHTTGAGLSLEEAVTMVDSKIIVPVNSPLRVGDIDLSPAAKEALTYAQECALEQGSKVICSSHLGVVLLQDLRSPLRGMLEAKGTSIRSVEDEVLISFEKYPEQVGQVMSMQQQMERLKLEYERMKSSHQDGGFQSSSYQVPKEEPQQQDDYDDIYN